MAEKLGECLALSEGPVQLSALMSGSSQLPVPLAPKESYTSGLLRQVHILTYRPNA